MILAHLLIVKVRSLQQSLGRSWGQLGKLRLW